MGGGGGLCCKGRTLKVKKCAGQSPVEAYGSIFEALDAYCCDQIC